MKKESFTVSRIVIIGGGKSGRGLAWAAAMRGIKSNIIEVSPDSAATSQTQLTSELDEEIKHWGITAGDKRTVLARTTFQHAYDFPKDVPIVFEATPEHEEAKLGIFRTLLEYVSPATVVATNSATLSITDMARKSNLGERFLGLRFAVPVQSRPLVEVIRGLQTSQDTFSLVSSFIVNLGKTPVEIFESPGAVTIRGVVPLLNESMHMLMEGVASAHDIDMAMKLGFDLREGPLEMADRIGLDVVLSWMEHMVDETKDPKFRPCPLLKKLVRSGQFGVKSNSGFFQYPRKDKTDKKAG